MRGFHGGVALPSVQGGVESGVDTTEPYSSGRRQQSKRKHLLTQPRGVRITNVLSHSPHNLT